MNNFPNLPNEHMDVFVRISKNEAYYNVSVIGRHKSDAAQESEFMRTSNPLTRMLLEQLLESFGFHQREVFDALDIEDGESSMVKHPLW